MALACKPQTWELPCKSRQSNKKTSANLLSAVTYQPGQLEAWGEDGAVTRGCTKNRCPLTETVQRFGSGQSQPVPYGVLKCLPFPMAPIITSLLLLLFVKYMKSSRLCFLVSCINAGQVSIRLGFPVRRKELVGEILNACLWHICVDLQCVGENERTHSWWVGPCHISLPWVGPPPVAYCFSEWTCPSALLLCRQNT